MKRSIAMFLLATGLTTAAVSSLADEQEYIPWTFDDFDSNCEVIEAAEAAPAEQMTAAVEINDDEAGELGW